MYDLGLSSCTFQEVVRRPKPRMGAGMDCQWKGRPMKLASASSTQRFGWAGDTGPRSGAECQINSTEELSPSLAAGWGRRVQRGLPGTPSLSMAATKPERRELFGRGWELWVSAGAPAPGHVPAQGTFALMEGAAWLR